MRTGSLSVYLLMAGVLCSFLCGAQSFPLQEIEYEGSNFTLPGSPMVSVYQTSDGFIWAGLYNRGIIRFTGSDVALYSEEAGINGNVRKIVEDHRGHLWLGNEVIKGDLGGVSYSSEPVTGGVLPDDLQFRYHAGDVALPRSNVIDLDVDANGQIWCVSDSLVEVYRWVGDTTLESVTIATEGRGSFGGTGVSVLPLEDGTVWVSFENGKLYRMRLPAASRRPLVIDSLQLEGARRIQLSLRDPDGSLWGYQKNSTLIRIDPETGAFTERQLSDGVNGFLRLDERTALVPSKVKGLFLVDMEKDAEVTNLDTENGLPSASLFDAIISREGDIWLASIDGLYRIPADFRAFTHYTDQAHGGRAPLLAEASINFVQSDIWLRNARGGRDTVTLAGLMNGLLVIPKNGEPYTIGEAEGLPITAVLGAVQDSSGGIYLTSLRSGIVYIHADGPRHPMAQNSTPLPAMGPGYRVDNFSAPPVFIPYLVSLPGGSGQSLWLGQSDRLTTFTPDLHRLQIILPFKYGSSFPLGIYLDKAAYLHVVGRSGWVRSRKPFTQERYAELLSPDKLTEDGTTYLIETDDSLFERVPIRHDGKEHDAAIAHLMIDDKLWLAVDSMLLQCDPATGKVERSVAFKAADHFCTALANRNDLIWAGTDGGLYAFRKSDLSLERFVVKAHGLLRSDNWSPNGLAVNEGGVVFQGTSAGLQAFDANRHLPDTNARPVYLTDNQYTENIWGRNQLSVAYAMLSYRDPGDNIRYQTQLAGYDEEWSEPTTDHRLRYTNLKAFLFPRTYFMQVRGVDYLGNTYATATGAYPVTVEPAIYFRWWAVLIYLGLLALAIRGYTRYRLREQEKELRLREAATIRQQRDEIAKKNAENETLLKEIHHRVKNNLEVVSSLLELQSATLSEGDALDAMRAGQSRVASMGLLHQKLYQGRDLATVNMREYLTELTDSITETYATGDHIRLSVTVPPDLTLDVDSAVPVGLIVNELVTNSLKYAFAGGPLMAGSATTLNGTDKKVSVSMSPAGRQESPHRQR